MQTSGEMCREIVKAHSVVITLAKAGDPVFQRQ